MTEEIKLESTETKEIIKPAPKIRAKPGRKPAVKPDYPAQKPAPTEFKPKLVEIVAEQPAIAPKTKKQICEEILHKKWLEDSKPVRGIFRNHEVPGAALEFDIRLYKWDPLKTYKLLDGQVSEIPRGIAKHINNNCNYPQNKYMVDEAGKSQVVVGLKVQRYSFTPLDFSDVGNDKPDIAIVTPI